MDILEGRMKPTTENREAVREARANTTATIVMLLFFAELLAIAFYFGTTLEF